MKIVVAIHGILTGQTSASWPDKLDAAWCNRVKVLKKEYRAGPFPLWNVLWKNPRLAIALANEIELFKHAEIYFVSHSNGTDIALRTIKTLAIRGIPTAGALFIGSVLPSDVRKSGILELVQLAYLRRAVAWASDGDEAITWGRHSLGYGGLGREGFQLDGKMHGACTRMLDGKQTCPIPDARIFTRWWDKYGHGTYFENQNLNLTFQQAAADLRIFKP
jgi:hypothetical protein